MRRHSVSLLLLLSVLACFLKFAKAERFRPSRLKRDAKVEDVYPVEDTGHEHEVLPQRLRVHLEVNGTTVTLDLQKRTKNYHAVPIIFANPDTKIDPPKLKENAGMYQDKQMVAAISVVTETKDGKLVRKLRGSFGVGDERFVIEPDDDDDDDDMNADAQFGSELGGGNGKGRPHKVHKAPTDGMGTVTVSDSIEVDPPVVVYEENGESTEPETAPRPPKRSKRATDVEDYHVEVVFVLDYTIYENWMQYSGNDIGLAVADIVFYFSEQINGIDMAYQSIDPAVDGFQISVWLKAIYISQTAAESPWTYNNRDTIGSTFRLTTVDTEQAIVDIGDWSVQDNRTWWDPDLTMLWTDYDLWTDTFTLDILGLAYLGGVCKPGIAASVVEDSGFNSWIVAAHELGHNLGGLHDGDATNTCQASDKYILAPGVGMYDATDIHKAYMFSTCSIDYFRDLLDGTTDGYPRVCVMNRQCEHGAESEVQQLPGEIYTPDEQCEMNYGPGSYFCSPNAADSCHLMHCRRTYNGKESCWSAFIGLAEGSYCDQTGTMWCRQGKCVAKVNDTVPPDSCCITTEIPTPVPTGCADLPGYIVTIGNVPGYTCADIGLSFPYFCFTDSSIPTKCCATCHLRGLSHHDEHVIDIDATLDCSAGTYILNGICVDCPPGYYQNVSCATGCEPCPLDSYQSAYGSAACDDCPTGQTTSGVGSTSLSQCTFEMTTITTTTGTTETTSGTTATTGTTAPTGTTATTGTTETRTTGTTSATETTSTGTTEEMTTDVTEDDFSAWQDLGSMTFLSETAALALGLDNVRVFARGTDKALWYLDCEGVSCGDWVSLGGDKPLSRPAALLADDKLFVFVCKGDDLARRWWDGEELKPWGRMKGVNCKGKPATVMVNPNRVAVLVRGQDSAIWIRWRLDAWGSWESLGGQMTTDPEAVALDGDRVVVFAGDVDNAVWAKWWDGSAWGEWERVGTKKIGGSVSAVSAGGGKIVAFGKPAGKVGIWHIWWNGTEWGNWEPLLGKNTMRPEAVHIGEGRVIVFIVHRDQGVWFRYWNGEEWGEWRSLNDGFLVGATPTAVSWEQGKVNVFATGIDNSVKRRYLL